MKQLQATWEDSLHDRILSQDETCEVNCIEILPEYDRVNRPLHIMNLKHLKLFLVFTMDILYQFAEMISESTNGIDIPVNWKIKNTAFLRDLVFKIVTHKGFFHSIMTFHKFFSSL